MIFSFVLTKMHVVMSFGVISCSRQVLGEDGANVSLQRLGHVRDVSSWRACEHNPGVTVFKKRIEFKIRMPLGPTIMAQVSGGGDG